MSTKAVKADAPQYTVIGTRSILWWGSVVPAGKAFKVGAGDLDALGKLGFSICGPDGHMQSIGAPQITTAALPDGVYGQRYSVTLEAGGIAPLSWSAVGLPQQLTLDAVTGEISTAEPRSGQDIQTPAIGSYGVVVKCSNESGEDVKPFVILIKAADKAQTPAPAGAPAAK
jgi:hypothetical protein